MIKRIVASFTVICLVVLIQIPPPAAYAAGIPISASSAILLDTASQHIIYSKTPYIKRAPASTTKVLTALVVLDHLPLDKTITIPAFAEDIQPSKVNLRAGERYKVRDLLRATLINSANDAAEVLGVAVAGSRSKFARLMNKKARAIGCKRSHFVRPSGLPAKGQYSTAYDLAMIMKAAKRHSFIVKTLRIKRTVIRSTTGRKIYLKNHNKMLWRDPRDIIGKTGWTRKAGHCFVGYIRIASKKAFVAIMGSHRLWRDLKTLMDYKFGISLLRIYQNRKLWGTADTKKIQMALKRAGFDPGPADGIFGKKTLDAVEDFQRARGLHVDGIVGPFTWKKLKSHL